MSLMGPRLSDSMNVVQTFFLEPSKLSKKNVGLKILAVALSVMTGLATLGLIHFSFWIYRKVIEKKPERRTESEQKVERVARNIAGAVSTSLGDYSLSKQRIQVKPGERLRGIMGGVLSTNPDKIRLLQQGIESFNSQVGGTGSSFEVIKIEMVKLIFGLGGDHTPDYFKIPFHDSSRAQVSHTPDFFDYIPTSGQEDYWVDFANCSLGGGCFGHGFVQEEIMVHEMPDLAEYIATHRSPGAPAWSSLSTREGSDVRTRMNVQQGSPTPLLMKGLHRVQEINGYGGDGHGATATPIRPQRVNILAIASPKLYDKNPRSQWDPRNLKDIFNTMVAGFSLVQRSSSLPFVIHSGKLGCGAFSQNQQAVYLLHRLAAQHFGYSIKLHGYTKDEIRQNQQVWKNLAPQFVGKSLEECINAISVYGLR